MNSKTNQGIEEEPNLTEKIHTMKIQPLFLNAIKNYVMLFVPIINYILVSWLIIDPVVKIIISMIIFHFLYGIWGFILIIKLISKKRIIKAKIALNIFQILAFSLLAGFFFNLLYGALAMMLNLYSFYLFYTLFFESLSVFFMIVNKRLNYTVKDIFSIKPTDIFVLLLILLPAFWLIITTFNYQPFPYYTGWDIFRYQGAAISIVQGNIRFLYGNLNSFLGELSYFPTGFPIIFANIIVSSNIEFIQLIEFSKLAVLYTDGFTMIWIYLILVSLKMPKSLAIGGCFMCYTFYGGKMLGLESVVPSTFAWLVGLGLIYFNLLLIKNKNVLISQQKILYCLICEACMIFTLFMLHFFIGIIMIVFALILLVYNSKLIRKFFYLPYLFLIAEVSYIIIGRMLDFHLVDQISTLLMGNSSYGTVYDQFQLLLLMVNIVFLIITVGSSIIFLLFANHNLKSWSFSYLFYVVLFFEPINTIYRIGFIVFVLYIVIFLNFIKISLESIAKLVKRTQNNKHALGKIKNIILLKKIQSNTSTLGKLKNTIFLKTIQKDKNALNKFRDVIVPFVFLVLIVLAVFPQKFGPPAFDESNKIINPETRRISYSSYSLEESSAAGWIAKNIDLKKSLCISDYGTQNIIYGLSGLPYFELIENNSHLNGRWTKTYYSGNSSGYAFHLVDFANYPNTLEIASNKTPAYLELIKRVTPFASGSLEFNVRMNCNSTTARNPQFVFTDDYYGYSYLYYRNRTVYWNGSNMTKEVVVHENLSVENWHHWKVSWSYGDAYASVYLDTVYLGKYYFNGINELIYFKIDTGDGDPSTNKMIWLNNFTISWDKYEEVDDWLGIFFYPRYCYDYFRFLLRTCSVKGFNLNALINIIYGIANSSNLQNYIHDKDFYLILTPRAHDWIQSIVTTEFYFASSSYINYTLINYIRSTPNIKNVYNNSEVFIFKI